MSILLALIGVFATMYLGNMTVSLAYPGIWFLGFIWFTGTTVLTLKRPVDSFSDLRTITKIHGGVAMTCLIVIVGGTIYGSGMLNASSLHARLVESPAKVFSEVLPPLDAKNAPLVSRLTADRMAAKTLSEIPALGAQVEIGVLEKQLIGGKLYWVGLLEYKSHLSWLNRSGTPGYVKVSATDASDVDLVTKVDGKELNLVYLTSASFHQDAARKIYNSLKWTSFFTDLSPEIDDRGMPYIVASIIEPTIGFGSSKTIGTAVLDPQTGVVTQYGLTDTPAWIDRLQPESIVTSMVEDRLEYLHGWFNPSKKDLLKVSGPADLVYGADNRAYFYYGLTSAGNDKSGSVGFMLVDTRTAEATRYSYSGATERMAQLAVEGVNPEKKYDATNALPFLVDGVPSYVMALEDRSGIVRAYGVAEVQDSQRVAVADTLPAAVRAFQSKSRVNRTGLPGTGVSTTTTLKTTVARIASEVRQGNTQYTLTLTDKGGTLFTADVNRSEYLAITKQGDIVEVTVDGADEVSQSIVEFKNLTILAASPSPVK